MRILLHACVLSMPALFSIQATAADMPDMNGTWKVTIEGVKILKEVGAASGVVHHTPVETGPYKAELTVVIESQDGGTFSGTKRSKNAEEMTAGVLSFDNSRVTMIDLDGWTTCTIVSPDEMRCEYIEVNAENSNLNRQVWIRQ